jgi:hypothetical protein
MAFNAPSHRGWAPGRPLRRGPKLETRHVRHPAAHTHDTAIAPPAAREAGRAAPDRNRHPGGSSVRCHVARKRTAHSAVVVTCTRVPPHRAARFYGGQRKFGALRTPPRHDSDGTNTKLACVRTLRCGTGLPDRRAHSSVCGNKKKVTYDVAAHCSTWCCPVVRHSVSGSAGPVYLPDDGSGSASARLSADVASTGELCGTTVAALGVQTLDVSSWYVILLKWMRMVLRF